jgi:hypothetical protein
MHTHEVLDRQRGQEHTGAEHATCVFDHPPGETAHVLPAISTVPDVPTSQRKYTPRGSSEYSHDSHRWTIKRR